MHGWMDEFAGLEMPVILRVSRLLGLGFCIAQFRFSNTQICSGASGYFRGSQTKSPTATGLGGGLGLRRVTKQKWTVVLGFLVF